MSKNVKLPNDGERMIPEEHKGGQTYGEHIARYDAATNLVKGKRVLDIACGTGYGTALLAKAAKSVVGVDVSAQAVEYATKKFARDNVTFRKGNGRDIPAKTAEFDVVVSYETIEHLQDYPGFIDEIKRVLKKDGLLIISTPNDKEFPVGNHFHLHQFEENELESLLKKSFKNLDKYYQATWVANIISCRDELVQEDMEFYAKTVQTAPIDETKFLYFFFLCSNRDIIEKIKPIVTTGEHWSARNILIKEKLTLDHIKNLEKLVKVLRKDLSDVRKENSKILSSKKWRLLTKVSATRRRFGRSGLKEGDT